MYINSVIDRWRVRKCIIDGETILKKFQIGQGVTKFVFKAHNTVENKMYAWCESRETGDTNFLKEAELIRDLKHTNIVECIGLDKVEIKKVSFIQNGVAVYNKKKQRLAFF